MEADLAEKARRNMETSRMHMEVAEARSKRFATKAAVMRLEAQRRNGG
jgi:hypothetical protein